VLAAALGLGLAGRADAQPVAGVGEDAIPIPARAWRLSIGPLWDEWDRRLVPGAGEQPLLGGLASAAFGSAQLPVLADAEDAVRRLTGDPAFSLTLGALEATGAVRRSTTLLTIDRGLTRRVSLGVRVPYVEVVHDARLVLDRDGQGANVGRNPTFLPQGGAANQGLHGQLARDGAALAEALLSCTATSTGQLCEAVRADPLAAQALVNRTRAFADAWRRVYGAEGFSGAPVIPAAGTDAHEAIRSQLAELAEALARYGFAITPAGLPGGALELFGPGGLEAIARDSAFGLLADTLGGAFRAGMGDVDVEARVLLYDTWRGDQTARLTDGRSGARLLGSAGWRFGTASSGQANEPFALALGEGVNALLLRLTADAVWRRRAWVSVTARYTAPLSDAAVLRLPGSGLPEEFFTSRPTAVSRSLASRLDLEVAPRLSLGEHVGVSGSWARRQFGGDAFVTADGERFTTPSGSVQFGAIGVTYSTLAPFVRGKSRLAVEVLFAHEVALSSRGVIVPALVRDRLELRVFRGFPRR
jgi:hypothetical protein